ncbi:MAG: DUF1036 domain-containing protein [Maricaulaceae bacterium]|nr:DUF1036 domain-containing protein [Maricaulaceae bacterium]
MGLRFSLFMCTAALALGGLSAPAQAQAARQALMTFCNDAHFAIGVAASYAVDPSGRRMTRGWFRVEANSCIEGAIDGVVGDEILLHARSGEWTWPASGGAEYCAPYYSFLQAAARPPCESEETRLSRFTAVPLRAFRTGWARGSWRVGCADLAGESAELCRVTPRDRDGFATPLRVLEVCNRTGSTALTAVAWPPGDGEVLVSGWYSLPAGECGELMQGFPPASVAYVHAQIDGRSPMAGRPHRLCVTSEHFDLSQPEDSLTGGRDCPEGQWSAPFREIRFARGVSRFTLDLTAMD